MVAIIRPLYREHCELLAASIRDAGSTRAALARCKTESLLRQIGRRRFGDGMQSRELEASLRNRGFGIVRSATCAEGLNPNACAGC